MITIMPLRMAMKETGITVDEVCKLAATSQRTYYRLVNNYRRISCKTVYRIARNLNCDISDLIEFRNDDGIAPECKGFALSDKDKWDLPHKWGPLFEKMNVYAFSEEDVKHYFGVTKRTWDARTVMARKGGWVKFKPRMVEGILNYTGCELWELCSDIKPKPKTVPLEQTFAEYMNKKEILRHEKINSKRHGKSL